MSELKENQAKAEQYLKRFKDNVTGHFINGEMLIPEGAETFDNPSPIDNTNLGQVVAGTTADVDQACEAAEAAFDEWRDMPGAERKKVLHRFADKLVERAEEIALVESVDCGQPIRFMRQALSTWKIAPALAAGCTVVHKPAEFSPLTAAILAEVSEEAELPKGVWNMVNGFGESVGKHLTEHPAIKAVAFVGETITGSHIMNQASPTLKRIHLELGGKNPVIVFDDADFERALDAVVFMIYSLNGQRCTSSSRLLIQSGIRDKFMAALEERVKNIRVGNPLDATTELGPLIHPTHMDKVLSYVDKARSEGATVAVGGNRREDLGEGNYVAATLFENNRNLPSPFGGVKMSGVGRDGGDYSFDFYMETKNVCLAHGTHRVPVLGR